MHASTPDASLDPPRRLRASHIAIAGVFVGAGILHFVIPRSYLAIVPALFPARLFLVYLSGAAEVAGGLGVLLPRTRRWAAIGLIALLAAVFPANVQMLAAAITAGKPHGQLALLWLRLPLQPLLMWIIWRAAGRRERTP